MKRALAEHGLDCSDIDRIVISHSHVDHYGEARIQKIESKGAVKTHPTGKLLGLTDKN